MSVRGEAAGFPEEVVLVRFLTLTKAGAYAEVDANCTSCIRESEVAEDLTGEDLFCYGVS